MGDKIDKKNYIGFFTLFTLGDLIGFDNNYKLRYSSSSDSRILIELISKFINDGGILNLDVKNLSISSVSLMHNLFINFIEKIDITSNSDKKLNSEQTILIKKQMYEFAKKHFIINEDQYEKDKYIGITKYNFTSFILEKMLELKDTTVEFKDDKYNKNLNDNNCVSRTMCIGLKYWKQTDLDKLIELSIRTGQFTHSSPSSYLGGLVVAYFVSLAIRKVDPKEWMKLAIELIKSKKIKSYLNLDDEDIYFNYKDFEYSLNNYYNNKFKNGVINNIESNSNLFYKIDFYSNIVVSLRNIEFNKQAGFNSASTIIIAYDALLDCGGNYEKIIFYAGLTNIYAAHSMACASGLFSLVYGYGDIPENLLNFNNKTKLEKLGKDWAELYY